MADEPAGACWADFVADVGRPDPDRNASAAGLGASTRLHGAMPPVANGVLILMGISIGVGIGCLAGQDAWRAQVLILLGSIVIALISPVLAICLLAVSFAMEAFTFGYGGQTLARMAGLGVGAVLFPQVVAAWVRRNQGRPVVSAAGLFLVGFLAFALYSGFFADDRAAWFTGVWMLFVRVALFACVVHYVRTVKHHRAVFGAVMAALAAGSLAGLAEWMWGVQFGPRVFMAEPDIGTIRVSGIFDQPIHLATAILPALACASYFVIHGKRFMRVGGMLVIPLLLFCLATTMVRSAALGVLVLLVVLYFVPPALPRWSKIALLIALAAAVAFAPSPVKKRFADPRFLMRERSIRSRVPMAVTAMRMAAANPFGVGLRNLHRHYDEYKGVRDLTTAKIAHNMFLELAAAIGIPGALCFLGWLTATLIALNRMRRELLARKAAPEAAVVVFLLAILAAMTFQGLVQTNFYQGKFFWLFMGLGTASTLHWSGCWHRRTTATGVHPVTGRA